MTNLDSDTVHIHTVSIHNFNEIPRIVQGFASAIRDDLQNAHDNGKVLTLELLTRQVKCADSENGDQND